MEIRYHTLSLSLLVFAGGKPVSWSGTLITLGVSLINSAHFLNLEPQLTQVQRHPV